MTDTADQSTATEHQPTPSDDGRHRSEVPAPLPPVTMRRQSAFRRWRKTRPFWGGLLTMLAGIEIAVATGTTYQLILVSKSVAFAITVGCVIAVFGLTMWLSPTLSKLLGLLTLVAALLSFVTSNLGGFMVGMLLAILGGGLAFGWEPGAPGVPVIKKAPAPDASPEDEPNAGLDLVIGPAVGPSAPAPAEPVSQDPAPRS
ncbi:MAG TPA: DUF6114 domain-containing protein [Nocardioides sp.]|nr:DUF6114 domain-containing protein [Nocardioides sp.]